MFGMIEGDIRTMVSKFDVRIRLVVVPIPPQFLNPHKEEGRMMEDDQSVGNEDVKEGVGDEKREELKMKNLSQKLQLLYQK